LTPALDFDDFQLTIDNGKLKTVSVSVELAKPQTRPQWNSMLSELLGGAGFPQFHEQAIRRAVLLCEDADNLCVSCEKLLGGVETLSNEIRLEGVEAEQLLVARIRVRFVVVSA
jgi:hypothetical protein